MPRKKYAVVKSDAGVELDQTAVGGGEGPRRGQQHRRAYGDAQDAGAAAPLPTVLHEPSLLYFEKTSRPTGITVAGGE